MISANLQQWIQHPETLNKDTLYELRTLVTRYPYFQSLRLLYLKNLYLLHDKMCIRDSLSMALVAVVLFSCKGGKKSVFTPTSSGRAYEILVVVDNPVWELSLIHI